MFNFDLNGQQGGGITGLDWSNPDAAMQQLFQSSDVLNYNNGQLGTMLQGNDPSLASSPLVDFGKLGDTDKLESDSMFGGMFDDFSMKDAEILGKFALGAYGLMQNRDRNKLAEKSRQDALNNMRFNSFNMANDYNAQEQNLQNLIAKEGTGLQRSGQQMLSFDEWNKQYG